MVHYKIIKKVTPKVWFYPLRAVHLPRLTTAPFGTPEHEKWVEKNWDLVDFSVFHTKKERAKELALELDQVFQTNPNAPEVKTIVRKLRRLRSKPIHKMTNVQRWDNGAFQLSNYCGDEKTIRTICDRLSKYSGKILEAMCGYASYFPEKEGREVVALDCSSEFLMRYDHPERLCILCNLDDVRSGRRMVFFEEGEFDAISICFGFRYPKHIGPLLREFRRILRPGGTLSFIENPKHGYEDLSFRIFDPTLAESLLVSSGFSTVKVKALKIPWWSSDRGTFYHAEAIK